MKSILRKIAVVAAVMGMVSMAATLNASAAPAVGAGAIVGITGTITPGLGTTPVPQSGGFGGTAVVAEGPNAAVNPVAGVGTCNFTYASEGSETILIGGGTAAGGCTTTVGVGVVANCRLAYTRVGLVVTVTGSCDFNGNTATVASELLFVPTNTTGTTFALAGAILIGPNT